MSHANSRSRGKETSIVTTVTFVIASIFVGARLIGRFAVLRNHTWDDYFMILGWVLALGLCISVNYGVSKGLGRHDSEISAQWLSSLRVSQYTFTILYNPALMASKTSILVFYLRLSDQTKRGLHIASYITLAVVNISGIVLTFINIFQCKPISAALTLADDQNCRSIVAIYSVSAPVNIVTDLAILALPIPVLAGLHLPQRQKTVLIVTFGLGIFVTIVNVVRIYFLQQTWTEESALAGTSSSYASEDDAGYDSSIAFMWSAIEVNVGIICACIPTLKPLFKCISNYTTSACATKAEKSSLQSPSHTPANNSAPASSLAGQYWDDFDDTPLSLSRSNGTRQRTVEFSTPNAESSVYFGFVNMKRPKSLLETRGRDFYKYFAVMLIIYILQGLSYGLVGVLNDEIAKLSGASMTQMLGLNAIYFAAYLFAPLSIGQYVLRKNGFKIAAITGFCILSLGNLIFWPSAVLRSIPGFMISTFISGFGLAILQMTANPFMVLCGPSKYAAFRILIAEVFQSSTAVIAQLLGQRVFFSPKSYEDRLDARSTLNDAQWIYLSMSLLVALLALFFHFMPIPEVTEAELESYSRNLDLGNPDSTAGSITIFSLSATNVTLAVATLSSFFTMGGVESVGVFFQKLVTSGPNIMTLVLKPASYVSLGMGLMPIGTFIAALLTLVIKPRTVFFASSLVVSIISALISFLPINDNTIAILILIVFFFQGPILGLALVQGLQGQGSNTIMASGFMLTSICGGALFPSFQWVIQSIDHRRFPYSFDVVFTVHSLATLSALFLSIHPTARRVMDSQLIPQSPHLNLTTGFRGEASPVKDSSLSHKPSFLTMIPRAISSGRGSSLKDAGSNECSQV